jgi:positive control factor
MKDLIVQYKHGLSLLRRQDKILKQQEENALQTGEAEQLAVIKSDRHLISGMISGMEYNIEWMETGKRPDSKRGAENLSAYQREISVDPNNYHLSKPTETSEKKSDNEIKMLEYQIEDLLWFLSKQEREVYILSYGYQFSKSKIAEMTGKTEGTISKFLQRARRKIKKNLKKDEKTA